MRPICRRHCDRVELLAAAVELPFDRAKMAIAGNMRNAIGTTALRIPLASLLLVSYDHVLLSLNKQ